MEVQLNKKLSKDLDKANKMFGPRKADLIRRRINEICAAPSLEVVRTIPQTKLHPLKGDMDGLFSVTTLDPFRMIIKPIGCEDISDLKAIEKVEIISLNIDYHKRNA